MMKDEVLAWREAAIEDGWSHWPTYTSEPEDRAMRLRRDGFVVSVLAREPTENGILKRSVYTIHGWGPDGLAITVEYPYSWEQIRDAVNVCGECGRHEVPTTRVAFANRACQECAPALRRKLETPGWCS